MGSNQNISDFKPLIPVDNSGMEEIADELINYKPKEKPKAEEIKEVPVQPIVQQTKKVKRKIALRVAGGIIGTLGGIVAVCAGIGAGLHYYSESKDYCRHNDDCVEARETIGFFDDIAMIKACRGGAMTMEISGSNDNYTMINVPHITDTLVERVITGGKEYVRGVDLSMDFSEYDDSWREYWEESGFGSELEKWTKEHGGENGSRAERSEPSNGGRSENGQ